MTILPLQITSDHLKSLCFRCFPLLNSTPVVSGQLALVGFNPGRLQIPHRPNWDSLRQCWSRPSDSVVTGIRVVKPNLEYRTRVIQCVKSTKIVINQIKIKSNHD